MKERKKQTFLIVNKCNQEIDNQYLMILIYLLRILPHYTLSCSFYLQFWANLSVIYFKIFT